MSFQHEQDALAMQLALAERLAKFGLMLHPDKTRVIQFGRFARKDRASFGIKPETFDFLGFTHIVGCNRRGGFLLMRRTSRKKRQVKLAKLKDEIERRRHHQVAEQHQWLCSVLRGHYGYYAVPTNHRALMQFRGSVAHRWHRALQRRSQRAAWTRARQQSFEDRFPLPIPRILHPWPTERFRSP